MVCLQMLYFSFICRFQVGPVHLSQALNISLSHDPLDPILWEPHLTALDRRVHLILKTIRQCVQQRKSNMASGEPAVDEIIIDDGF